MSVMATFYDPPPKKFLASLLIYGGEILKKSKPINDGQSKQCAWALEFSQSLYLADFKCKRIEKRERRKIFQGMLAGHQNLSL